MSSNIIHQHGTTHLQVTASSAHTAGDLVYEGGFFGTVEDDCSAGDVVTLQLDPTVNFTRVPSTVAMGKVVAALATSIATTLPIGLADAATLGQPIGATAGFVPIGKAIATGTASTAKIQLFNPNPYSAA